MITYLDGQIGRVLARLEETGEYDNTVIIFTSDHGLAIGSHGLMGKQSLYDVAMKPPFIFCGPGIRQGKTDALVYLHDIFPTVCDLAGIRVPEGLMARSFAPVLTTPAAAGRDALFLAYLDVQRAVRQGDWKLIRYPRVNITQLFNLRSDPHEMNNLADSMPEKVRELTALLAELQKANDDAVPLSTDVPDDPAVTPEKLRGKARKLNIPPKPKPNRKGATP